MSMEFKPDALKDFPDWKTSNNRRDCRGDWKVVYSMNQSR